MQIVAKSLLHLSEDELLKALETAEDTKSSINPIIDFIMRFGVKTGQTRVTMQFLYQTYLLYYPKDVTIHEFNKEATKHLKLHKHFYFLNKEFVDNHLGINPKQSKKIRPENTENKRKHFVAFIKSIKAEKGSNPIPAIILYDIYRKYCHENKKKYTSFKTFKSYINLLFETLPSNDYLVLYCVDKNTASITPNKDYSEIRKNYEKEENPKIKLSVSSNRKISKSKK